MARFSIIIPDELAETVRARADREGVSLAEVGRRALSAWCTADGVPDAPPCTTAPEASETDATALSDAIARVDILASDLEAATVERDRAREDLAAERVRVAVLEAEAKKDAEHIRSLQSAIATVAAGARPALDTIADQDQGRPGILASARARVRAFMAR